MSHTKVSYSERDFSWSLLPSRNEAVFRNILPAKQSLLDSSKNDQNQYIFVFVKSFSETKKLPESCGIYFAPSVNFFEEKQKALKNIKSSPIDFGIDPYSLGLWQSKLFKINPIEINCEIFDKHKYFRFSSLAYDLAGANDAQQISILLASFIQLIEDYEGALNVQEIAQMTSFEMTLDSNIFKSISKLHCFRILYSLILKNLGLNDHQAPLIMAMHSPRYLASREIWNNILRLTSVNIAAKLGGANGVVNLPYDLFSGGQQNRLSRNIGLILDEESYLSKVSDPTQGSFSSKDYLSNMITKSNNFYSEVLKKGGLKKTLSSGWLQDEVQREAKKVNEDFINCKKIITGVNDFCLLHSLDSKNPLPESKNIIDLEDWFDDYICKEPLEGQRDVERLIPEQLSKKFEKWQFLGDNNREKCTIFFNVELGLENSAKAINVKRLLALGGFEVVSTGKPKLHIVVASDPEGDFVHNCLKKIRRESGSIVIWAGDKQMKNFDAFLGKNQCLPEFFEKIYKKLGVH